MLSTSCCCLQVRWGPQFRSFLHYQQSLMNLKQSLACIGLATGAIFSIAAPAFAGSLTPSKLGLDTLDPINKPIVERNLAPLSAFPYQAQTFSFSKDTQVRFSLLNPSGLGSRGKAMSSFGFLTNPIKGVGAFTDIFAEKKPYDKVGDASYENKNQGGKIDDWLGSCGKAIAGNCQRTILFKANTNYQLALNPDSKPFHFGVGALDSFTFNKVSDEQYPKSDERVTVAKAGALFIGMEDGLYRKGGEFYYDYQDWVVTAAVPEPATLIGLGVVASGMLLARRRKAGVSP